MKNVLMCAYTKDLEEQSMLAGFENSLFLERDFAVVDEKEWKVYLKALEKLRRSKLDILVKVYSDQQLVHAIEQSKAKYILNAENVHYKDSVHYLRAGYDQALLRTCKRRGKVICFSFDQFVDSGSRKSSRLLSRMKQNMRLCRKEKVEVLVSSFSSVVSFDANQIASFVRVLEKQHKPSA